MKLEVRKLLEVGVRFTSNLPLVRDFYWWGFITGEEGFWKYAACAYQHLYRQMNLTAK